MSVDWLWLHPHVHDIFAMAAASLPRTTAAADSFAQSLAFPEVAAAASVDSVGSVAVAPALALAHTSPVAVLTFAAAWTAGEEEDSVAASPAIVPWAHWD